VFYSTFIVGYRERARVGNRAQECSILLFYKARVAAQLCKQESSLFYSTFYSVTEKEFYSTFLVGYRERATECSNDRSAQECSNLEERVANRAQECSILLFYKDRYATVVAVLFYEDRAQLCKQESSVTERSVYTR
jgi:hypothetical protein